MNALHIHTRMTRQEIDYSNYKTLERLLDDVLELSNTFNSDGDLLLTEIQYCELCKMRFDVQTKIEKLKP